METVNGAPAEPVPEYTIQVSLMSDGNVRVGWTGKSFIPLLGLLDHARDEVKRTMEARRLAAEPVVQGVRALPPDIKLR